MTDLDVDSRFGAVLRHWRRSRGLSQLELAERAGLSARHLSFLETGRCGASRGTVLQLGRALDLLAEEVERLLLIAGHAGDWSRRRGDVGEMGRLLRGLRPLVTAHDPYPAFIGDPAWRVVSANRGALALHRRIREMNPAIRDRPVNLLEILPDARGLGELFVGWPGLLKAVVRGLYQLEPDPACFGHTAELLGVLPECEPLALAIEEAAGASLWTHEVEISDDGCRFPIRLLSLPFGGAASGFALVMTQPGTEDAERIGCVYFQALIARLA